VVLLGDFNLPEIDWHYYHGPDNVICNTFLRFINSYGLTQYVDQPTRESNILDLIFSCSSSFVKDLCIEPPIGTSDHNVILFTPNINCLHNNNDDILVQQFYSWKNADYQAINESLHSIDWNIIFQTCFNVEDCWNTFTTILNNVIVQYVPKVRVSVGHNTTHKIQYPQYVKRLIHDKAIAWKRSKMSCLPEDKAAYKAVASKCSDAIKKVSCCKRTGDDT